MSQSRGTKRKHSATQKIYEDNPAPSPPEISSHILVGINSITRHLESLAANSAPSTSPASQDDPIQNKGDIRHLSLIVIPHPSPSFSPLYAHLPTLLHLSTIQSDPSKSTRLVTLSTTADVRLATALHIPRLGAMGIFDGAPGAKGLEEFVREKFGVTECKWVDEALGAGWKGVNVQTA